MNAKEQVYFFDYKSSKAGEAKSEIMAKTQNEAIIKAEAYASFNNKKLSCLYDGEMNPIMIW